MHPGLIVLILCLKL